MLRRLFHVDHQSQSKTLVLSSFANFLEHGLAPFDDSQGDQEYRPDWFMSTSFTSPAASKAFQNTLRGSQKPTGQQVSPSRLGLSGSHDRGQFYGTCPLYDVSNEQTLSDLDMSGILADISALADESNSEESQETATLRLVSVSVSSG